MKILFFTDKIPDYLQDGLLHGFRTIFKENLIDFPKKNWLYKTCKTDINTLKRKEFTFYRLLDDIEIDRTNIFGRIENNEFDFIIFSSIHRQINLFQKFFPILKNKRLVFIDGEDHPAIIPFRWKYWRNPLFFFSFPAIHKKYPYFKREYTPKTVRYRYYKLINSKTAEKIKLKNVFPISFAFPEEKIIKKLPRKEKIFPEHIVDVEIANRIKKSQIYVFNNEKDYFSDIQKSRFGITTKRAGWDAMRHYEIAANGTVICFKNLDKKPVTCAPHGLNKTNTIIYSSFEDLMEKINSITPEKYKELQINALKWVKAHTTTNLARYVLNVIFKFYS